MAVWRLGPPAWPGLCPTLTHRDGLKFLGGNHTCTCKHKLALGSLDTSRLYPRVLNHFCGQSASGSLGSLQITLHQNPYHLKLSSRSWTSFSSRALGICVLWSAKKYNLQVERKGLLLTCSTDNFTYRGS